MEQYLPILKRTKLMAGVAEDEIRSMLQCLDARLHRYRKGEYVFRQGEHIQHITVLAEGELHLQRDDYWGNRTIIQRIAEGEMFGEACLAPENSAILHDVVAVEDSAVIFFDVRRVITVCGANCRNLTCWFSAYSRAGVPRAGGAVWKAPPRTRWSPPG